MKIIKILMLSLLVLFTASALIFTSCGGSPGGDSDGDGDGDGDFTWEGGEFDLQDFFTEGMFDDVEDGGDVYSLLFPGGDNADRKDSPLSPAGANTEHVKFEFIEGSGVKITAEAGWGAGIDLNHAYFGFQAGDKITVSGNLPTAATPGVYMNTAGGVGDSYAWSVKTAGNFTEEYVLTAADITKIKTTSDTNPQAIRIAAKPAGTAFFITNITVERTGAPPPPPTPDASALKFATEAADGKTVINVVGGTASAVTDAGFTITKSASFQASYIWFEYDFGDGNTLSDFESMKLVYEGVSGDLAYKDIVLMAAKGTNPFGASLNNDAKIEELRLGQPRWNSYGSPPAWAPGPQMNGTDEMNVTFTFDKGDTPRGTATEDPDDTDRLAAVDAQVVYFGIYLQGNDATVYKISNVRFVPNSGGDEGGNGELINPIDPEGDYGNMGVPAYQAGDSDAEGAESQLAWEVSTKNFEAIEKLVFVFENAISGGMQLIWQNKDGAGFSGWNSNDILTNVGAAITNLTEVSADKKTLTVFPAAFKAPPDGTELETQVKVILAYYSGANKIRGLGIVSANIIYGEGGNEGDEGDDPPVEPGEACECPDCECGDDCACTEGENCTCEDCDGTEGGGDEGDEPPEPITVSFGVAASEVTPSSAGSVAYEADNSGFTLTNKNDAANQGNQNFYASFPVDLGDLTLADIEKITFTFEGLAGDTEWKNLELWASENVMEGNPWSTPPIDQTDVGKTKPQYQQNSTPMTIEIDADKAADITTNIVHLCIFLNGFANDEADADNAAIGEGNATSYKITNVVLVPISAE